MKALFYLYRNLNNGKFSLKHKGLVTNHPVAIVMNQVVFKISTKGQARVRRLQVKNVHALVGAASYEILEPESVNIEGLREVYYCPYQCDTFVVKETNEPVFEAEKLIGLNNKVFIP